jgi:4-hydroxybutyrate CoA-transferase
MTGKSVKWQSAVDALSHVTNGMTVAFPHLSAEPLALTAALWHRAAEISNLTVYSGMLLSGYKFLNSPAAANIKFKTWFMPGTLLRKTASDIQADYLPLTWSQTARFLRSVPIDVGLVQVSPANAEGFHSLGVNCTVSRAILQNAKFVIGQVNAEMPRTRGDSLVHSSQFDVLVDATQPLPEFPHRPTDEIDNSIGLRIADFVPDGATLQFGIGGIPGAAVEALIEKGRRDLTIISMLTDPARRLIEAGCGSTGSPKAFVGDILGTSDLYRWVHENDAIALADALTTHTIESFLKRKNLVAINSGLEVDLFGQVNSETLGGRQAGAIGGSVDFAIAGQVEGAQSLIGIRSTTKDGQSRIVRRLDSEIVTISRTLVQTVVTEFGVADLKNKSVNERAVAIANIAHPDHRPALLEEAAKLR